MKKCETCFEIKPLAAFNKRRQGYQTRCRECEKTYKAEHYQQNKAYYIQKANYSKEKKRDWLIAYKESHPCFDCEIQYPYYVTDFDHRPGEEKTGNVGDMLELSLTILEKEIAKCDLVCANCHRMRTFERKPKRRKHDRPSLIGK